MKKTIPLILVLLLFAAVLPLQTRAMASGADAGAAVVLDIAGGSHEAAVGGQVTFKIKALNSVNLLGIQAALHFNPDKLKLRADGIAVAAPFAGVGRSEAAGEIAVPFINKSPSADMVASMAVASFTFDVVAEGGTEIWLSGIKAVNQSYREIQANTETERIELALKKFDSSGPTPTPSPSPGGTPGPGTSPTPSPSPDGPGSGSNTDPSPDPSSSPGPTPSPTPSPGGPGSGSNTDPSPDPSPSPSPDATPGSGGPGPGPGSGSNGSGPGPVSNPGSGQNSNPNSPAGSAAADNDVAAYPIGKADLVINDGKAVVILPDGKSEAMLTADAVQALQDGVLTVKNGEAAITFDGRNLRALLIAGGKDLSGAAISIGLKPLAAGEWPAVAAQPGAEAYRIDGLAYELELHAVSADGTEYRLSSFEWPVTLTLPYSGGADTNRIGIYTFDKAAKEWTYIYGATADNGAISAPLAHFSEYAVFAYEKKFADVDEVQWFAQAVSILTSRHIVDGTDETHFMPDAKVTRAQFAALLARALQLQTHSDDSFADVSRSAWYASAVAAASEAHLIEGLGEGRFAPDSPVTREQLAVIAVRAAKMLDYTIPAQTTELFKDGDAIASWARESVNEAHSAGLMNGMAGGRFEPKQDVTRAQAAAVICNLLQLAE